jgi:hypothetical protein
MENTLSPFDAWSTYVSCTLHFNSGSSYDAFKFNFKGPRCKRETFAAHPQRYTFEKACSKFKLKNDLIGYYVSNIIAGNTWIGSMTDDVYSKWQGCLQSMEYNFKNNLSDISNQGLSFDDLFKCEYEGDLPYLYKCHHAGKMSLETLTILDILVSYTKNINTNDPLDIGKVLSNRIRSYKPFLQQKIDAGKYRNYVLKLFTYANN